MYQRHFQKIQAQTTAHLAQTMTLLSMNLNALNEEINKNLNENPALIIKEERICPVCGTHLQDRQTCPKCSQPRLNQPNEDIILVSARGEMVQGSGSDSGDLFSDEMLGSEEIGIEEYILRQIAAELTEQEKIIAAYILNQIDEDGFFEEDIEEVANYYHVPLSSVDKVKTIIQKADPIGVGSSSPEEAMRIQLDEFREMGEVKDYYFEICEKYLKHLFKKQFKEISQSLGISISQVQAVSEFFSKNLNPFPTRAHWGTFRQPTIKDIKTYTNPDVIISHVNNDSNQPLLVEVIVPSISILEINPLYSQAIKEAKEDVKNDLRIDYEKANLFIKCLQQRNNTMQRLLEKVTTKQKEYILKGEKFNLPLTRAQLAKELKVHESTISRAVSDKSVQMPDGKIIPLSAFFDRSLGIRTELKEIISYEDKKKPFSDSELAKKLAQKGYDVARRTVAKYRLMEGIMPAYQRKSVNKNANQ